MTERLYAMLIDHEDLRLKPYLDCCGKAWRECQCEKKGKLTIGVGRNLDDVGMTQPEAMIFLGNDIQKAHGFAATLSWFGALSDARQDVVISMIFNVGAKTFLDFKRTIAALQTQDFRKAADEMLSSAWAAEVGARAVELAEIMRLGAYP